MRVFKCEGASPSACALACVCSRVRAQMHARLHVLCAIFYLRVLSLWQLACHTGFVTTIPPQCDIQESIKVSASNLLLLLLLLLPCPPCRPSAVHKSPPSANTPVHELGASWGHEPAFSQQTFAPLCTRAHLQPIYPTNTSSKAGLSFTCPCEERKRDAKKTLLTSVNQGIGAP